MDLSSPMSSVIPSVHGVVLSVLARAETPLSGRRTADLTGGRASRRQVDAVLRRLTEAGVVLRERHPPANLYRLNHEHVAAPAICALADLREQLLDRMRALVDTWDPAASAVWLFGSAARGDGTAASDIDVLVLRPDRVHPDDQGWLRQVDELCSKVTAWSGNRCQALEYSEGQLATLVTDRERLVSELQTDALRIAGDSIDERTRAHAGVA